VSAEIYRKIYIIFVNLLKLSPGFLYVVGLNARLDNILNWISNRCTIQGLEKTKVLPLISVRSADAL
jgi:hypothetical protein